MRTRRACRAGSGGPAHPGRGSRTAADPEFGGCATTSARPSTHWRWRRRSSPSSTWRPAGSGWRYRRSPTPTRCRAARGDRLPGSRTHLRGLEHGDSWRNLLAPLVHNADDVVGLLLGDKRSPPTDIPAAVQLGLRMLRQGTPAWGSLRGEDARALFTGVAAHTISRMPSFVAAGAGLMLATLAHTAAGWCRWRQPGDRRRADRRPQGARRCPAHRVRGGRTTVGRGPLRHRAHRPARHLR